MAQCLPARRFVPLSVETCLLLVIRWRKRRQKPVAHNVYHLHHGILWFVPMPGPRKTAFKNNRSIAGYQPRYVGFEAKRITCPRPWRSTVAKDELASRCLASGHSRPLSRKSSSSTSRTGVSVGCIDIITLSFPTMTGKNLPSPKPSQCAMCGGGGPWATPR